MDPNRNQPPSRRRNTPYETRQTHPTVPTNEQGGNSGPADYSAQDAALFAQLSAGSSSAPPNVLPQAASDFPFDPFESLLQGGDHPFYQSPFDQGITGMTQGDMAPEPSSLDIGFPWDTTFTTNPAPFSSPGGGPPGPLGFTTPPPIAGSSIAGSSIAGSSIAGSSSTSSRDLPNTLSPSLSPQISRTRSAPSSDENEEPDTRTEAERATHAEEKRRRNTAASARFRVKKKQKIETLERTVAELTTRGDQLEKEVAELRRENGWLKELVLMRGTKDAALDAMAQLAEKSKELQAGSSRGPVKDTPKEDEEDSSSENPDSDEGSDSEAAGNSSARKGKGKSK